MWFTQPFPKGKMISSRKKQSHNNHRFGRPESIDPGSPPVQQGKELCLTVHLPNPKLCTWKILINNSSPNTDMLQQVPFVRLKSKIHLLRSHPRFCMYAFITRTLNVGSYSHCPWLLETWIFKNGRQLGPHWPGLNAVSLLSNLEIRQIVWPLCTCFFDRRGMITQQCMSEN